MQSAAEFTALFEQLSTEAIGLAEKPRLSPEFAAWHRNLLAAVQDCFGSPSPELDTIRALQFEVGPEVIETLLRTFANPEELDEQQKKLGSPLDAKVKEGMVSLSQQPGGWLERMQQHHYQKMLNRASELLGELSIAARLRSS